jgi:hypothetical protein
MIPRAPRPHWSSEENRLSLRLAQKLAAGRYQSVNDAVWDFQREMERLRQDHPNAIGLKKLRSTAAIGSRIKRMADEMKHDKPVEPHTQPVHTRVARPVRSTKTPPSSERRRPRVWTPERLAVVDRYARALVQGRYRTGQEATRDCAAEIDRPGPAAPVSPVSRFDLCVRLLRRARDMGLIPVNQPWTPREIRVLDTYARALARGRYHSAAEASRAFQQDMAQLRQRYPHAEWLAVKRSICGIRVRICQRARVLGRPLPEFWSPAEDRLITRFAQRVVDGQCRSAHLAAIEYLKQIERLRARYPKLEWLKARRGLRGVHTRIWQRTLVLGRPLLAVYWSPFEKTLLDQYARRFLAGGFPTAKVAARDCVKAIERLHSAHPDARWARVRRTFGAIFLRLKQVIHARGGPWRHCKLEPGETKILDRYAAALVRGEFSDARAAAEQCRQEMDRRFRRQQARHPDLKISPARSQSAIRAQLILRSQALGRPRGWSFWSPEESRIARRWAVKYVKTRGHRGELTFRTAARALLLELRRNSHDRDWSSCRNRLMILVYGRRRGDKWTPPAVTAQPQSTKGN